MLENYKLKLNEIFETVLQPIDSIYKNTAINNYKKALFMDTNTTFGEQYYKLLSDNKSNGTVYTPLEICTYILSNTIFTKDVIENPFIRIVDPSCGCGNFLFPLYTYLFHIYMDNLQVINENHKIHLTEENLSKHIIDNNIFGFDIDETSIKAYLVDVFVLRGYINLKNIKVCDFLLGDMEGNFNIIIGNPPYVGHKTVEKEYSAILKNQFGKIYKDKSDLSYCFFLSSLKYLVKNGKLTFITSRYFLESPSGEELRKVLKNYYTINRIVDFYGIRPFKGIGIDPVIMFIDNLCSEEYDIDVIKPNTNVLDRGKSFYTSLFHNKGNDYHKFSINKNLLNNKGWILRDESSRNIINKIEKKSFTTLSNICESYQGIITGCDNAFVVDKDLIEEYKIEEDLIRPWIKSSYIESFKVNFKGKYLIYSNFIEKEEEYPYSIAYIRKHELKLNKRRECINGVRKWYQLQWGRNSEIFEEEKIIFPYKSTNNRFSIDKGSYFSADVYCLVLKDNVPFTYEYLLRILNSDVYEYYFKSFAKKLGENQYEYYPNNIMKLCIPTMMHKGSIDNSWLYEYFELDENEINLIKEEIEEN